MWRISAHLKENFKQISTHTSRVGCDSFLMQKGWNGRDFYSHIPCGMWPQEEWDAPITHTISTHTSRVGCDVEVMLNVYASQNFYSHIPCGMWRQWFIHKQQYQNFYSHIPCGMWRCVAFLFHLQMYFYSHIPCGMWRMTPKQKQKREKISTHTSRVGCDRIIGVLQHSSDISTHTSRVGCDCSWSGWKSR